MELFEIRRTGQDEHPNVSVGIECKAVEVRILQGEMKVRMKSGCSEMHRLVKASENRSFCLFAGRDPAKGMPRKK
jgi:hypothetical protein